MSKTPFGMTHAEIVTKLVGKINPIGETNTDNVRFENLKVMCKLVDELFTSIALVADSNKTAHEFSRKRAYDYAEKFLTELVYNP